MKEDPLTAGGRTIPVVLAIDAEPEPGGGTWREPVPWRGFEHWLEYVPRLRDSLAALSGAPAHFAWFVRCDRQIGDVYGDQAWAADHYATGFARLKAAGDEIGIHPHTWRWDTEARHWIHDNANPAWVESVLEAGFERFAAGFGEPALAHRFGSRFMNAAIARWLAAHGVRVDTTLEPGSPGLTTLDRNAAFTGTVPDQRSVPREPYRPDPDDPFRPASTRTLPGELGLWMLPHSAFDPQPLIPRWRQLARRVRFFGQQRHRPGQLWTNLDATGFWDQAVRAAETLPRPYLFLALRSSALIDVADNVTAKLDALERHPAVRRMRFVTSLEALDLLIAGE